MNARTVTVFSTFLLLIVLYSYPTSMVMADSGSGSFTLAVSGYAINGNLQNAVINPDGSVSMKMVLDGTVSTTLGPVPITANGVWAGMRNGSAVSGTIQGVAGSVNFCYWFWCGAANFIGQGQWGGSLSPNSTQGSGDFQGTITFTSSDFPGIQVGQPEPISGTWNANFVN